MKTVGDTYSVNHEILCTVVAVQLDLFDNESISYYDNGAAVSSLLFWNLWKEAIHCKITDPRREQIDSLLDKMMSDMDSQWPYNENMLKNICNNLKVGL